MIRVRILDGNNTHEEWQLDRLITEHRNGRVGMESNTDVFWFAPYDRYSSIWVRDSSTGSILIEKNRAFDRLRILMTEGGDGQPNIEIVNPRLTGDVSFEEVREEQVSVPTPNIEVREINPEPTIDRGDGIIGQIQSRPYISLTSANIRSFFEDGGSIPPQQYTWSYSDLMQPTSLLSTTNKPIKVSRKNTIEVGDIVACMDRTFATIGIVTNIHNLISVRADDGLTSSWGGPLTNNPQVTILTKLPKVGDMVRQITEDTRFRYLETSVGRVTRVTVPSESDRSRPRHEDIPSGIMKLSVEFPEYPSYCVYSDEVELVEDDIIEKEVEEMKPLSKQEELKIPLNYPKINFKHKQLGELKKQEGNIYGYIFDDNHILQYMSTNFKDTDKPYFKFNIVKREVKYESIWSKKTLDSIYKDASPKKQVKFSEYQINLGKIKDTEQIIQDLCLVKVINYNESGDVFGYKPSKKEMLGKYFRIIDIDYNYYHESTKTTKSIITLNNTKNNRDLKFLITDLEFIVPDPTLWLKSYNKPKDRTIRLGVNVKVVDDKYGSVTKGEKLKVKNIDTEKYILTINSYEKPRRRNLEEVTIRQRQQREGDLLGISIDESFSESKKNKKTKVNPNCHVWCLNEKGKEVKVKIKQLKVI